MYFMIEKFVKTTHSNTYTFFEHLSEHILLWQQNLPTLQLPCVPSPSPGVPPDGLFEHFSKLTIRSL